MTTDPISNYITNGIFGHGNCSWIEHPEKDPLFSIAKKHGLAWRGAPVSDGWHRIHYMHCAGACVDRAPLTRDGDRFKVSGIDGWVDQFQAEWMPIPDSRFGMGGFPVEENQEST